MADDPTIQPPPPLPHGLVRRHLADLPQTGSGVRRPDYSGLEMILLVVGWLAFLFGVPAMFVETIRIGSGLAIIGLLMMLGAKVLVYLRSIWALLDEQQRQR